MGVCTGGALATVFFRVFPTHPSLLADSAWARLLARPELQVGILAAVLVTLAAGLAERVSRGSERATILLVVADGIAFCASLAVYFSLART
jgi:hypothetical protein